MVTAAPPTAPPVRPDHRPRRRRRFPGWLRWTLVVLLAVALITAAALIIGRGSTNDTPLHPDNPGPEGVMAISRVLGERGVSVRTVTRHRALLKADLGPDDTVVITATRTLDRGAARRLRPELEQAGRVIVVGDGFSRLTDLGLPVSLISDSAPTDDLQSGCSTGVLPPAARAEGLGRSFDSTDPAWQGCFATEDGAAVQVGPYGSGTGVVIGSTDFARNGDLLRADHAQLALWLYGSTERLHWYLPDPGDTVDDGGPGAEDVPIAPDWFLPELVLLSLAVLLLMVARGRRFGPLSREPMPVVVSALETTRTRGRLYRGAGDIKHSAALLRDAAVGRLARRVGLPADAGAERVAALLGPTHPAAPDLLTGPLPSTATEATRWLNDLRRLEDEVADD